MEGEEVVEILRAAAARAACAGFEAEVGEVQVVEVWEVDPGDEGVKGGAAVGVACYVSVVWMAGGWWEMQSQSFEIRHGV